MRIALVAGDKLSLAGLVRILGVVGAVGDGLGYRLALVHMERFDPCRRQFQGKRQIDHVSDKVKNRDKL